MSEEIPEIVRDNELVVLRLARYVVDLRVHDPNAPPSAPQIRERWRCFDRRPIGRGGQGQVYLQTCVEGPRQGSVRAVKRIDIPESDSKRLYIRELEAITKFSHEKYRSNFVQSSGWYYGRNCLFISMEYCPGGDLQTLLDNERLDETNCRYIIFQVLKGLSAMHTEGFTHGDIKPKNILIKQRATADGPHTWWIKLADFGISKRVREASGISTVIGTPEYMAPEHRFNFNGRSTSYYASDMWAVGAMAFRMLTATPYWCERNPELFLNELGVSHDGQSFIQQVGCRDPKERLNAQGAVEHPWVNLYPRSIEGSVVGESEEDGSSDEWSDTSSAHASFPPRAGLTSEVITPNSSPSVLNTAAITEPTVRPNHKSPGQKNLEKGREVNSGRSMNPSSANQNVQLQAAFDLGHQIGTQNSISAIPPPLDPMVITMHESYSLTQLRNTLRQNHRMVENSSTRCLFVPLGGFDIGFGLDHLRPLSAASSDGNESAAIFHLKMGADIEELDISKRTPLLIACERGKYGVVKLLLGRGANIEARSLSGQTPLAHAAMCGQKKTAELLVERGANIEAISISGQTPLSWAATYGHIDVVRYLLGRGSHIESGGNRGQTPLIWAAMYGRQEVVQVLLIHGANIQAKSKNGRTALQWALEKGHENIVELLIEAGAYENTQKYLGKGLLFQALEEGAQDRIAKITSHAISLEERDAINQTALSKAAELGNLAAVELLLDRGAEIEARSYVGQTPLSRAAQYGLTPMIQLLVSRGAVINSRSSDGRTPLTWAVVFNEQQAVGTLLDLGADVNARSENGWTPILWAIEKRHFGLAEILFARGASLEEDKIADLAAPGLLGTLLGCNYTDSPTMGQMALSWAAERGRNALIEKLLDSGSPIEQTSSSGQTPLSWAAANGQVTTAQLLIFRGAKIESRSNNGQTPLSWAATCGHHSIVKLLLEKGANIESRSYSGQTPLSWAFMYGRISCVRLLLSRGADIQSRSNNGFSSLEWADEKGQDMTSLAPWIHQSVTAIKA